MVIRVSQKIATKVRLKPTASLPLDDNPFADWTTHGFSADRTQYVMITNTASLYSTVTYGRGITDDIRLIVRSLEAIRELMVDDGLEFIYRQFVAPASDRISFSKALNRSVTGSMNDLVYHAKMWLTEGELSPFDTAFKLNEMPMSALGYSQPREAIKSLDMPRAQSED